MFVTKSKHDEEIEKLNRQLRSQRIEYEGKIKRLEKKLETKNEIEYNLRFPQPPHSIEVSRYVADNFIENKLERTSNSPFTRYLYHGLYVKVNDSLAKYDVRFLAKWVEPPIICVQCGSKKEYEWAYPKDNPKFCDSSCFERHFLKKGGIR